MRLDFGVDAIDIGYGIAEKVELLGMRGRKHPLQRELWADFKAHLRDLRGVPTHWSVDEVKKQIRVWPVPNMAMHVEVTMTIPPQPNPPPIIVTEPEVLPPLNKPRRVERRA